MFDACCLFINNLFKNRRMPVANEVYAAVLTVVFGIVCLIGTVEIYRKRAHPFIKV